MTTSLAEPTIGFPARFNVGVVADRDAFPDIDAFAAGAREELQALGVSTCPTSGRRGADAAGARPYRDGQPAVERGDEVRSSPKPLVASEGRW